MVVPPRPLRGVISHLIKIAPMVPSFPIPVSHKLTSQLAAQAGATFLQIRCIAEGLAALLRVHRWF